MACGFRIRVNYYTSPLIWTVRHSQSNVGGSWAGLRCNWESGDAGPNPAGCWPTAWPRTSSLNPTDVPHHPEKEWFTPSANVYWYECNYHSFTKHVFWVYTEENHCCQLSLQVRKEVTFQVVCLFCKIMPHPWHLKWEIEGYPPQAPQWV